MTTAVGAAKHGTIEEFRAVYEPGTANEELDDTGKTLLHYALGNNDPANRVAIANLLLDDGADATTLSGLEAYNVLHILLDQGTHDFTLEAPLLRRLLDAGADVNGLAERVGTPLQTLGGNARFSDAKLAPFYDVLLSRPDLDLHKKGKLGRSTLESVRKYGPRRQNLLERAEEYDREHGGGIRPQTREPDARMSSYIEFIPHAGACIASKNVISGAGRVRWMLRLESKDPVDNGWRIFSHIDSGEYLADPNNLQVVAYNDVCAIEPALIGIYDFEVGADLQIVDDGDGIKIFDTPTGREVPPENFYVPPAWRAGN